MEQPIRHARARSAQARGVFLPHTDCQHLAHVLRAFVPDEFRSLPDGQVQCRPHRGDQIAPHPVAYRAQKR
jgi:hypothetical protein